MAVEYNGKRIMLGISTEGVTDKVDKRLSAYTEFTDTSRLNANLYIDDNGTSKRISLQTIKKMNTKILSVDNHDEINGQSIVQDDYIFIKE